MVSLESVQYTSFPRLTGPEQSDSLPEASGYQSRYNQQYDQAGVTKDHYE